MAPCSPKASLRSADRSLAWLKGGVGRGDVLGMAGPGRVYTTRPGVPAGVDAFSAASGDRLWMWEARAPVSLLGVSGGVVVAAAGPGSRSGERYRSGKVDMGGPRPGKAGTVARGVAGGVRAATWSA